jgi:hypothetical protein
MLCPRFGPARELLNTTAMRPRGWLLATVLLLAGCTHRTEERKLLQSIEPVQSWAATLDYVSHQWLLNRVPTAYARRCAESAADAAAQGLKSIDESQASHDLRDSLRVEVKDAAKHADSLEHAFASADHAAAERDAARFGAIRTHLEAVKKKYEDAS